ncbi:MAG: gamma-glutamyl-gamma-aminobutyrate hydrolase family protein [Phycisphaerales bacterium]
MKPLVGVTTDLVEIYGTLRSAAGVAYARAVEEAGGVPVLLAPVVALVPEYLARLDAFVFTGGKDADTELFGQPRHPKSDLIHPDRQAFETALLGALRDRRPEAPALGICLGMQMMSLAAGGRLNQNLPDTLSTHEHHVGNRVHAVAPSAATAARYGIASGTVCSSHRQGVADPGRLAVLAYADDGVIEAVADPSRPYYVGVQWHPERTRDALLGAGLFHRFVDAARGIR